SMLLLVKMFNSIFLGPSEVSAAVRYNRRPTCPDTSVAGSLPTPPVPRHRKSHSLGNKFANRGRLYATLGPNWRVPVRNSPRSRSCVYSPTGACSCQLGSPAGAIAMEGPLRRKTLLKEGKKPALSSWTRYWVTLSGSTLLYFGVKSLRGKERKHYKSTPCKKVSIIGWMVVLPDDPEHPDIFQLNDPDKGNVYKFQTGSRFHAILWHKHLGDACKSSRPQVPANLMSFE
uniref:PH domain-containing protein n=1 Tax=Latimeria chalumnae TaxID=7897 RepID=H3A102_LATCH